MSDLTTSTDIDTFMGSANNAAVLPGLNLPAGAAVIPPASTGRAQAQDDNGFVRPTMVNPDGSYALLDQDTIFICMANTGSGVTKGQAVYVNGVNANTKPNVGLAKADAIATAYCLGFALDTVADGAALRVLTIGRLSAVTTPVGVTTGRLFLSDSVAGSYSNTAPTLPTSFSCSLGYCRVADSSGVTGSIEARATTPVPNVGGILRAIFNGLGTVPLISSNGQAYVGLIKAPYDCTINSAALTCDNPTGTASVDVRAMLAANYPANAPAGSFPTTILTAPLVLTASASQSVQLTPGFVSSGPGANGNLSKGDWLQFYLNGVTNLFKLDVLLSVTKR